MPVAQLKLGMHVLRADGRYGVITSYRIVPNITGSVRRLAVLM